MENYKNLSLTNIEGEIWVDIKEWEGCYAVSTFARVKSLARTIYYKNSNGTICSYTTKDIILVQSDCEGYLKVDFYRNAIGYKKFVHILVATAFIPNPENKPEVNHKKGNRKNNLPNDLEWNTSKENSVHARDVLKRIFGNNTGKFGILSISSKKIQQLSMDGNLIKEWDSISDAKRGLNIKSNHIASCCTGKLKHAYGYKWKHK